MMFGKARTRRRLHGHSIGANDVRTHGALRVAPADAARALGAGSVFPHAPVGLVYVTQRIKIDVSTRPFEPDKLKMAIRRMIDANWRAAELVIEVDKLDKDTLTPWLQVAVKVRTAKRGPETPTAEATAEDIEALFNGYKDSLASASAALEMDIHEVDSPRTELGRFGDAALQAAFDAVRITFVGPAPKLILSVCKRKKPPWMTLSAWFVLKDPTVGMAAGGTADPAVGADSSGSADSAHLSIADPQHHLLHLHAGTY